MEKKDQDPPQSERRGGHVLPDGRKIRTLRQKMNWTAEELSHRSGVSTGSISKIENGGYASVKTIHDIALALGVDYDALAPGHELPSRLMPGQKAPARRADLVLPPDAERLNDGTFLVQFLNQLMDKVQATQPIIVVKVAETVKPIITIELGESDLSRLAGALADRKLDGLRVSEIILTNSSQSASPSAIPDLTVYPVPRIPYLRWLTFPLLPLAAALIPKDDSGPILKFWSDLVAREPRTVVAEMDGSRSVILRRCS